MKKVILTFGLISGLLITGMMLYSAGMCYSNPQQFKSNDVLGYTALIASFAFIFVGIKNYRDKYNNKIISFGKAFKVGAFITLVASTMYVVTWLIDYYLFIPDFLDRYIDHVLYAAKADGATEAEIAAKTTEMANYKEMYKNPLLVVLVTYFEVLPIGLVIALISALILKRKTLNQKTEAG